MSVAITPGGPATLDELLASRRIATLDTDTLHNVRAIAVNWRNASVVGAVLTAGAAYVTSATSIQNLSPSAVTHLEWTASAAAVSALLSIMFAMYAAFGWPTDLTISSPNDLLAWEKKAAKKAKRALRISLIAGVVSIGAVGGSVGIVVFGPTTTPEVSVTFRVGNPQCYVKLEQDNDKLLGIESSKAAESVDPKTIATITSASNC